MGSAVHRMSKTNTSNDDTKVPSRTAVQVYHAPYLHVLELLDGHKVTQCLCVAIWLGVADQLNDGPKACADLARRAERLRQLGNQSGIPSAPHATGNGNPRANAKSRMIPPLNLFWSPGNTPLPAVCQIVWTVQLAGRVPTLDA